MATKEELIKALAEKGVTADPEAHPATLAKQLKDLDTPPTPSTTADTKPIVTESALPAKEVPEGMMKISDVRALIAEALAQQAADAKQPIKLKRSTEHTAHVWRLDGKWVVDFKDRNNDPYVKGKVHAFQKFNEQKREFEAWIEVVFDDGSTKELPLVTYVKNRVPIYCPIIKRHQMDKSFSFGEVEKKKEVGDKLIPSGVVVDQEVTMYEELFEMKTPEGVLKIPSYAIA